MSDHTGPTITHQAHEYLSDRMTRGWSKWTDGSVTYVDYETTWVMDANMYYPLEHIVYWGSDLKPPPDLKWVETSKEEGS